MEDLKADIIELKLQLENADLAVFQTQQVVNSLRAENEKHETAYRALYKQFAQLTAENAAMKPDLKKAVIEEERLHAENRKLRVMLTEVEEVLTEMGWHTDRGVLMRVRETLGRTT